MTSSSSRRNKNNNKKGIPEAFLKTLLALFTASYIIFLPHHTAAQTQCPQHYYNGTPPRITNSNMQPKSREICYSAFAVEHSGISRTPLWSAEHLTRANIEEAKKLDRVGKFHPETTLPPDERAELSDYTKSGYDRGHLSPNADMPDRSAQQESFSLANVIPQDPSCNRNIFEWIESSVRHYATGIGQLYIITGPLFLGDNIEQLNNRVLIPTHIYKIIYEPKSKRGGAYLVRNMPGNEYEKLNIDQLEEMAGIIFFPDLSQTDKQRMLDLPKPASRHGGTGGQNKKNTSTNNMMRWLFR